jgi:hypothetical protein
MLRSAVGAGETERAIGVDQHQRQDPMRQFEELD